MCVVRVGVVGIVEVIVWFNVFVKLEVIEVFFNKGILFVMEDFV